MMMMTTYVSYNEQGATFADGTVLSGTWTAEYDNNNNLLAVVGVNLTATNGSVSTVFTASPSIMTGGSGSTAPSGSKPYQVLFNNGNNNSFYNLYLD